jgi:hypothetical protein
MTARNGLWCAIVLVIGLTIGFFVGRRWGAKPNAKPVVLGVSGILSVEPKILRGEDIEWNGPTNSSFLIKFPGMDPCIGLSTTPSDTVRCKIKEDALFGPYHYKVCYDNNNCPGDPTIKVTSNGGVELLATIPKLSAKTSAEGRSGTIFCDKDHNDARVNGLFGSTGEILEWQAESNIKAFHLDLSGQCDPPNVNAQQPMQQPTCTITQKTPGQYSYSVKVEMTTGQCQDGTGTLTVLQ